MFSVYFFVPIFDHINTVNNISKSYGAQKRLMQFHFLLKKEKLLVFLGPNGAGKSTFIATYLAADNGVAHVNGHDVTTNPKAVQPP
jgi:ABC-2 type transport system ATP-binding protein